MPGYGSVSLTSPVSGASPSVGPEWGLAFLWLCRRVFLSSLPRLFEGPVPHGLGIREQVRRAGPFLATGNGWHRFTARLRSPCLFSVTTLRSAQWSLIGRIWPVRRRYLTTILCLYTPLCRRPWWRAGSSTGWCKPSQPRTFVGRLSVPMMFASSPSVWTGPAARTSNTSCRTGFGLQHTRFWAITWRHHVRPFFRPLLRLVRWSNTSSCPGDLFSDWLLESSFVYILIIL